MNNLKHRKLASIVGAFVLALVALPGALAECGLVTKQIKPTGWQSQLEGAQVVQVADDEKTAPSIVGMWHVVFTAKKSNDVAIPDTVIDNALVVWHADHTEIMNSVRPPQDGNFCLGVWEETGPMKYHLNHFAWFANAFPNDNPSGIGDPTGPSRFIEDVTLAPDGIHFSGTFSLYGHDTTGKTVQTFTGVLAGTRITTKTSTAELL